MLTAAGLEDGERDTYGVDAEVSLGRNSSKADQAMTMLQETLVGGAIPLLGFSLSVFSANGGSTSLLVSLIVS